MIRSEDLYRIELVQDKLFRSGEYWTEMVQDDMLRSEELYRIELNQDKVFRSG